MVFRTTDWKDAGEVNSGRAETGRVVVGFWLGDAGEEASEPGRTVTVTVVTIVVASVGSRWWGVAEVCPRRRERKRRDCAFRMRIFERYFVLLQVCVAVVINRGDKLDRIIRSRKSSRSGVGRSGVEGRGRGRGSRVASWEHLVDL